MWFDCVFVCIVLAMNECIETKEGDVVSQLHMAATYSLKLVESLIERGADVNTVTQCGWPVLHYAILHGQHKSEEQEKFFLGDMVKLLIENGADVRAATHGKQYSVLHAVIYRYFQSGISKECYMVQDFDSLVSLLTSYGADINAVDADGCSVLQAFLIKKCYLMGGNRYHAVLLNHGADTKTADLDAVGEMSVYQSRQFLLQ